MTKSRPGGQAAWRVAGVMAAASVLVVALVTIPRAHAVPDPRQQWALKSGQIKSATTQECVGLRDGVYREVAGLRPCTTPLGLSPSSPQDSMEAGKQTWYTDAATFISTSSSIPSVPAVPSGPVVPVVPSVPAVPAVPSGPSPLSGGAQLKNAYTQACLTIDTTSSSVQGSSVFVDQCTVEGQQSVIPGAAQAQLWLFDKGTQQIKHVPSGLCLSVTGTAGSVLFLAECLENQAGPTAVPTSANPTSTNSGQTAGPSQAQSSPGGNESKSGGPGNGNSGGSGGGGGGGSGDDNGKDEEKSPTKTPTKTVTVTEKPTSSKTAPEKDSLNDLSPQKTGNHGEPTDAKLPGGTFKDSVTQRVDCDGTSDGYPITYDLTKYHKFHTVAGLLSHAPADLTVDMSVAVDGQVAQIVTVSTQVQGSIDLTFAGARTLALRAVRKSGTCESGDEISPYAVWGSPSLTDD